MTSTNINSHSKDVLASVKGPSLPGYGVGILALLSIWVLAPRGLSIRPLEWAPRVDLARLALFGIVVIALFSMLRLRVTAWVYAPRSTLLIIGIITCQLLSAIVNHAYPRVFGWWAAYLLGSWLFALCLISVIGKPEWKRRVCRLFALLGLILSIWALLEFSFDGTIQAFHSVRDAALAQYVGADANPIGARRFRWLPLGPFDTNHLLAMSLMLLGTPLLMGNFLSKKRIWIALSVFMLVIAIVCSQMLVTLIAMIPVLFLVWKGQSGYRKWLPVVAFVVGIYILVAASIQTGGDGTISVVLEDHANSQRQGSLNVRATNLIDVFSQLDGLAKVGFGFGPGALTDWYRTGQQIKTITDVGVIFHLAIETGIPSGALFIILILAAVRQGLKAKSVETRGLAIGLVGYCIIGLSSADYAVQGLAVLSAGLIESWARVEVDVRDC